MFQLTSIHALDTSGKIAKGDLTSSQLTKITEFCKVSEEFDIADLHQSHVKHSGFTKRLMGLF